MPMMLSNHSIHQVTAFLDPQNDHPIHLFYFLIYCDFAVFDYECNRVRLAEHLNYRFWNYTHRSPRFVNEQAYSKFGFILLPPCHGMLAAVININLMDNTMLI